MKCDSGIIEEYLKYSIRIPKPSAFSSLNSSRLSIAIPITILGTDVFITIPRDVVRISNHLIPYHTRSDQFSFFNFRTNSS